MEKAAQGLGSVLGRAVIKVSSAEEEQPDWAAVVMELMAFMAHQDEPEVGAAMVSALLSGMGQWSYDFDGGPTSPTYQSRFPHLRAAADAAQRQREDQWPQPPVGWRARRPRPAPGMGSANEAPHGPT